MKKIMVTLVLLAAAQIASAQINFTNACNYKIALQGVTIKDLHAVEDESGDWLGKGFVTFTTPAQPTNMPAGVTMNPIALTWNCDVQIYCTAAEVGAKAGSNELVRANKVLKDKVRTLGSNLKAELAQ